MSRCEESSNNKIFFLFIFFKVVELVGGGLPRLVYIKQNHTALRSNFPPYIIFHGKLVYTLNYVYHMCHVTHRGDEHCVWGGGCYNRAYP